MKKVLELLNTGVTNLNNGDTDIWNHMKSILLCLQINLKFEVKNSANQQSQDVRSRNKVLAKIDLSKEVSSGIDSSLVADTLKSPSKDSSTNLTNIVPLITRKDTTTDTDQAKTTEFIHQVCVESSPDSL